jgi:hypothetical protein
MSSAGATAAVESVLARCLLDADFLGAVSSDPAAALAGYDLDERTRGDLEALDFSKVRKFAGFITKVQHNYLWDPMPFTRALLKHHGVEIELFAAYHARHLELREEGASRPAKISSFLEFAQAFVTERDYPGLREILLHERIRWELESLPPTGTVPDARVDPGPLGKLVPHARGRVRVARFELSPLAIEQQLASGRFEPSELSAGKRDLAYWSDPGSEQLRILEIDELTAALVSEVDGKRSVRAVVARVAGRAADDETAERVRPVFEGLADAGLLALVARG